MGINLWENANIRYKGVSNFIAFFFKTIKMRCFFTGLFYYDI
jgi:hypothetical protein